MAEVTKEEVKEFIRNMSVLELSQLVKELEEEFGVSAAAPVAMVGGAGAPAGGEAAAAEEKTEFRRDDVLSVYTDFSDAHYNHRRRLSAGRVRHNLSFESYSFTLYAAQDLCRYPDAQKGTQGICLLADKNKQICPVSGNKSQKYVKIGNIETAAI